MELQNAMTEIGKKKRGSSSSTVKKKAVDAGNLQNKQPGVQVTQIWEGAQTQKDKSRTR